MRQELAQEFVPVWDPFVRAGHWVVVAGFAVAYLVGDESLRLHVWAGYVVGGVVAGRLVWGFVGPRYARFTDFIYRPRAVITYAFDLLRLRSPRYLGHSPAGGAMVIALLIMLGATVYSGLMVYALENNRGPLATVVMAVPASPIAATALADDARDDDDAAAPSDKKAEDPDARARREFWKDLHEWISDATVVLIALHIGGVALASFAHRENLVWAMVTGRKRRDME